MNSLILTLVRELFTTKEFTRVPESDLIMSSKDAVSAFVRASKPYGLLGGIHAFQIEHACRLIRPGNRVLDLGCGPAWLLASIAEKNPDASFVGVDLSPSMISAGNEALAAYGSQNVELRIDDMCLLNTVESGSVDVVLSSMALHHLPDYTHLQRCFAAIERIMAPAARFLITDFGRVKSLKSAEYFVRQAIPTDEPILMRDYRASLRAAFSRDEFNQALSSHLAKRIQVYSTAIIPLFIVLATPGDTKISASDRRTREFVRKLPTKCRRDFQQLRTFLRLGGM